MNPYRGRGAGGGDTSDRLQIESQLSSRYFDVVSICSGRCCSTANTREGKVKWVHIRLPKLAEDIVKISFMLELLYSTIVFLKLMSLGFSKSYDLIWFHGSNIVAFFYLMFGWNRQSVVIYDDGGPLPQFVKPWIARRASIILRRIVFKRASGIILFGSMAFGDSMVKLFRLDKNKTLVSPPPIKMGLLADNGLLTPGAQEIRGSATVLYVASISPRKNQLALLKAIPDVIKRNDKTEFLFVGPILDANYYGVLTDFVRRHELSNLKFTGVVSDAELSRCYKSADVVVLLSLREGLAKTMIEAMSYGKAIVASSIPENLECAKSGDEIVFVNPDNGLEIAAAINSLIANPEERKEVGAKARATAARWFEFERVYESIMNFIETMMNSNQKVQAK